MKKSCSNCGTLAKCTCYICKDYSKWYCKECTKIIWKQYTEGKKQDGKCEIHLNPNP